jgi:hypothetical protein
VRSKIRQDQHLQQVQDIEDNEDVAGQQLGTQVSPPPPRAPEPCWQRGLYTSHRCVRTCTLSAYAEL